MRRANALRIFFGQETKLTSESNANFEVRLLLCSILFVTRFPIKNRRAAP